MGQHHFHELHDALGRAAKLKGAVITLRGASERNKGVFQVHLETIRPRGSAYIGVCRVDMVGKGPHGKAPCFEGGFEFNLMDSSLDIKAIHISFKAAFRLANFNLSGQSGRGMFTDKTDGQKDASPAEVVTWRVDHWGKAAAHVDHCKEPIIF